ncbi:MAG: DUF1186 domain-containing protein [Victivallaceae bacterium]
MDVAHILEDLAYDVGSLPREAIEAAVAKRDIISPYLLSILEEAIDRIPEIIEDESYQGHLYAMYLLAQFREIRAFPLIMQLFSFSGDIPHAIAGDVLTEDLPRIMASLCDNIRLIQEIIENPNINEYVRAAAETSLVVMVGVGKQDRNSVIDYFRQLLEYKLEKVQSFAWDNLIAVACSLYPEELLISIKKAFDADLIDPSFISFEDVTNIINEETKRDCLLELHQTTELIEDTLSEMEKWLENDPISPFENY